MKEFISLAFEWSMGNSWLLLGFGIVGMILGYLVLTKLFTHRIYWNTWDKNLFHPLSAIPSKNNTLNRKHVLAPFGLEIMVKRKAGIGNRKLLVRQIPLFLQTLSNAFKAGYSLEQAFLFIAQEIDPPLQQAIQKINEKIQLHIPIEQALEDFAQTLHHPDIDFFVESTIIQLRTGGNLVELFHKVADLVEEKRKLAQDIKSFTSSGKMSGILIAILWPVSLVLFSLIAPDHMHVLFYTAAGQCLLVLSLLLELLGFVCIWKIIRVKI